MLNYVYVGLHFVFGIGLNLIWFILHFTHGIGFYSLGLGFTAVGLGFWEVRGRWVRVCGGSRPFRLGFR